VSVDVVEEGFERVDPLLNTRREASPFDRRDDPRNKVQGKGRSSPPRAKVTPRSENVLPSWSKRKRRSSALKFWRMSTISL